MCLADKSSPDDNAHKRNKYKHKGLYHVIFSQSLSFDVFLNHQVQDLLIEQ